MTLRDIDQSGPRAGSCANSLRVLTRPVARRRRPLSGCEAAELRLTRGLSLPTWRGLLRQPAQLTCETSCCSSGRREHPFPATDPDPDPRRAALRADMALGSEAALAGHPRRRGSVDITATTHLPSRRPNVRGGGQLLAVPTPPKLFATHLRRRPRPSASSRARPAGPRRRCPIFGDKQPLFGDKQPPSDRIVGDSLDWDVLEPATQ